MIYQIPLEVIGYVVGLLLIIAHVFSLVRKKQAISWAKAFPRSRAFATLLLIIAAIWSFLLVRTMDLGEFSNFRTIMLIAIVVGAVMSWLYVDEFLAVRSLGILLLLAAEPILESAALRQEPTRLLLVVLAYAWIIEGLFFVGMPYVLRDAIAWMAANPMRWKISCLVGMVWGMAVLSCAIFLW